MDEMEQADREKLIELSQDVKNLVRSFEELKKQLTDGYPTKEVAKSLSDRIALLEKIVFGGIGIVIITVLGSIITLVIKK